MDIYQAVLDYFEDYSLQWLRRNDQLKFLNLGIGGENCKYICTIGEKENQLFASTSLPIVVPKNRRSDIAILLNIINSKGLPVKFELDKNDGEVQCVSRNVDGELVNSIIIDKIVRTNLTIVDEYFSLIVRLIFSNKSLRHLSPGTQETPEGHPIQRGLSDN